MFQGMSPEEQAQMSFALRMMQGGGPSAQPVGFGQNIGSAGLGAMGDYSQLIAQAAQQKQQQRAMEMDEQRMKQQMEVQKHQMKMAEMGIGLDQRKLELESDKFLAEGEREKRKTQSLDAFKQSGLGAPLAGLAQQQGAFAPSQQAGISMMANAPDMQTYMTGFNQTYGYQPPKPEPMQLKQVWDPATQTATYVPEAQAVGKAAPPPMGFMATPPVYTPQEAAGANTPQAQRELLAAKLKQAKTQLLPKAQIDSIEQEYKRVDEQVKATDRQVNELSDAFAKRGVDGIGAALGRVTEVISKYPQGQDIPGFGLTASVPETMLSEEGIQARQALFDLGNQIIRMRTGAAMGVQEANRIGAAMGLDLSGDTVKPMAWKSDASIRNAMPGVFDEIKRAMANAEAGVSKEALEAYRQRGGPVNSAQVDEYLKAISSKKKEDYSTLSNEQLLQMLGQP